MTNNDLPMVASAYLENVWNYHEYPEDIDTLLVTSTACLQDNFLRTCTIYWELKDVWL